MSLDIATFSSTFTKNIAKAFYNQADDAMKYSVMSQIFNVSDSSEYTASFTSTEASNGTDWVTESNNYPESSLEKGYKTAFESAEFGHKLMITKKARNKVKDSTEKVLELWNKQKNYAITALHGFLERNTTGIFNEAFSSTKYLAPDGQTLISATHERKSSVTTRSNLVPTQVLSSTVVDIVEKTGGAFKSADGEQMPLNFKYCMVKKGSSASRIALKLFAARNAQGQYSPTTIGAINIYEWSYRVIENPRMTNDTAYFFLTEDQERSVFADFIERPKLQNMISERENLDRYTIAGGSMRYGINNQPFDIMGGHN